MDRPPPIDIHDEFGLDEDSGDVRAVIWAAAALALAFVIAALAIWGVFA